MAIPELTTTAMFLAVFGALMLLSVVLWRQMNRFGVPVVLLFLILGMLGGSEGIGGITFDDHEVAFQLGTLALVLILFDGGFNTALSTVRQSFLPATALATAGVVITAGIVATIGVALGLTWGEAFLIGAIVSSTDAAAVFAVLRGGGIKLKSKVRGVLELESCVNDPMAVILTVTVIELLRSPDVPVFQLILAIPIQLAVGAAAGTAIGYGGRYLLEHLKLSMGGLYPVFTLSLAIVSFGATTLIGGSGFLAVFATGFTIANGHIPYRQGLARVHDAVAWISQITLFLMLGLLVFPSKLFEVTELGIMLGLALALVARPVATLLCLLPFKFSLKETGYIGWVGLRGAVPIVLAIFPVFAGIPGTDKIFHIVFFIVVVSAVIPGASILPLSRKWRLLEQSRASPPAALEVHSIARLNGEIRHYQIDPSVYACDLTLSEIAVPAGAGIVLISRGDQIVAARGNTKLQAGDHIYVFCDLASREAVENLFAPRTDHDSRNT